MVILEKWYSHLRAYLPVYYKKKKKTEILDTEIIPLLNKAYEQIEIMNETYNSSFEGLRSCGEEEKSFNKIMRGIFERLDQITAMSEVIEGQNYEEPMKV
jgi:hypothetical protein